MSRQWIEPKYSKSRIKTAGKHIRDDNFTDDDIHVLENHRASHAYIINTFNVALRRRGRDKNVIFAQRLKRKKTIFDKLKREPSMQLSTMHDIAGARVIFENLDNLYLFRKSLHSAKVDHVLRTKDDDRYNYIINPKSTGYRGIHDVYEYKVRSAQGVKWNGLLIEIQYRTKYQHAWATAVEVADLVNSSRIKFDDAESIQTRFFQLASELIARTHEAKNSCCPQLSDAELLEEFEATEQRTGLIQTFRKLQIAQSTTQFRTNTILIFNLRDPSAGLRSETFDSVIKAISRYEALEKELSGAADIVLVRSDSPEAIRDAFRNYYSDVNEFLKYLDIARATIKHNSRYGRYIQIAF